jgi:hypothetical protein
MHATQKQPLLYDLCTCQQLVPVNNGRKTVQQSRCGPCTTTKASPHWVNSMRQGSAQGPLDSDIVRMVMILLQLLPISYQGW